MPIFNPEEIEFDETPTAPSTSAAGAGKTYAPDEIEFDDEPAQTPGLKIPGEPTATWGETVKAIPGLVIQSGKEAVGGLIQMAGEHTPEPMGGLLPTSADETIAADSETIGQEKKTNPVAQFGKELGAEARKEIERITPKNQTFWQEAVTGAGTSIGTAVPGVVAAMILKNPIPLAASFGINEAGQSYSEARSKGIPEDRAISYAKLNGMIEVGTELIPAIQLFKKGTGPFKRLLQMYASEIPGENIATLGQSLNGYISGLDPNLTAGEMIERLKMTTASTAIATPIQSGMASAAHKAAEKISERKPGLNLPGEAEPAATAEPSPTSTPFAPTHILQDGTVTQKIEEGVVIDRQGNIYSEEDATPTPAPNRPPETSFTGEVDLTGGSSPEIKTGEAIPSETAAEIDLTQEPVAAPLQGGLKLPGVTDAIEGYVSGERTAPSVPAAPGAPAVSEAIEGYLGGRGKGLRLPSESSTGRSMTPEVQSGQIVESVQFDKKAKLPDGPKAPADMKDEEIAAERAAMPQLRDQLTPEMAKRDQAPYKEQVVRQNKQKQLDRQTLLDQDRTAKETAAAERAQKKAQAAGNRSLAQLVRDSGGINEKTLIGEVRDRFSIKEGYNLINRKTGKPLDRLREMAVEEGYLSEDSTVADFLELLRQDVDSLFQKGEGKIFGRGYEPVLPDYPDEIRGLRSENRSQLRKRSTETAAADDLIMRLREENEMLRREAREDPLTGLPNYRAYKEAYENRTDKSRPYRKKHQVALDFDGLGWINDHWGHEVGNAFIKSFAGAVRRIGIETYRVGGDEFMAMESDEAAANEKLKLLREILKNDIIEVEYEAHPTRRFQGLGISFGVGINEKAADEALYADKERRTKAGERAQKGQKPPASKELPPDDTDRAGDDVPDFPGISPEGGETEADHDHLAGDERDAGDGDGDRHRQGRESDNDGERAAGASSFQLTSEEPLQETPAKEPPKQAEKFSGAETMQVGTKPIIGAEPTDFFKPIEPETEQGSLLDQKLEEARAAVDTNPSEAQIEANNYKHGHISVQGLNISIENPKGSVRKVGDKEFPMRFDYGYIKGTVSSGDKEHIDAYLGPNLDSEKVFVVYQVNPEKNAYDEEKVMLGFDTAAQAKAAYLQQYDDPAFFGAMAQMNMQSFKDRLAFLNRMEDPSQGALSPITLLKLKADLAKNSKKEKQAKNLERLKKAAAPKETAVDASKKIEDFGEKIGGARKDTAASTGSRGKAEEPADETPAWRKRFIPMQSLKTGRWTIHDTRTGRDLRGDGWSAMTFDSEEAAIKAIPLAAVSQKHRVYSTHVKDQPEKHEIWRLVTDKKRVKVIDQQFDTREDAMRYMAEHAEEILNVKTNFGEEILAKPKRVFRKGPERRKGDVRDRDFLDSFGFRGVEFGNWNNQEERQVVMNHAYDGLLDLAELLNIPPKALSLNGDLALAFGSRGQGLTGARAHYERDYGVINLTKMSGAGSLAHEWFHSLDHYFGRQDGKAKSEKVRNDRGDLVFPATDRGQDLVSHGFGYKSNVRPEIQKAYNDLINTMFRKAEKYVEDTERAEKFVGSMREDLQSRLNDLRNELSRKREYGKRHTAPASAEQLAAFDVLADRLVSGQNLTSTYKPNPKSAGIKMGSRGWSAGRMTNDTLEAMSEIFKEVRGRSGFNSEGTGVFDYIRSAMNRYAERIKMLADASAGTEKAKMVPTSFAMDAKRIDQGRASDYWTTPHEMAARAFSAYVEDKVAEADRRSDFLSYGSDNNLLEYRLLNVRPFPEGAERKAINAAFDQFVSELKTKETEKGTALFSPADRPAPGFFSQLRKVVEEKMPNAAPGIQVRNIIEKGGVKAEEIEWSGILDWLSERASSPRTENLESLAPKDLSDATTAYTKLLANLFTGEAHTITKQQVLDFIDQNNVQVQEVKLGEPDELDAAGGATIEGENGERIALILRRDDEGIYRWHEKDADERMGRGSNVDSDTGVSGKTIEEARNNAEDAWRGWDLQFDNEGTFKSTKPTKFSANTLAGGENYRELLLTLPMKSRQRSVRVERGQGGAFDYRIFDNNTGEELAFGLTRERAEKEAELFSKYDEKTSFRSSHFDEPNIIAHVRFNDRTDADGKKTLFIEEIQSDWAQKGRKEGFSGNPKITDEAVRSWADISLKFWNESKESEREEMRREYQAEMQGAKGGSIPPAPFVTKTESWAGLALKRMLRYAAENGYDRLAWTTGTIQSERYDLSKHISQVHYSGSNLKAYDHRGEAVISQTGIMPEQLPDLIGKEIAERLMAQAPRGTLRTLSGLDIKVGGKGMIGFYDQILPAFLNKYAKKWGAKVADIEIPGMLSEVPRFNKDTGKDVYPVQSVHSIDITPAMKESVMIEGQPLFRPGSEAAALTAEQLQPILDDLQRIIAPGSTVEVLREVKAHSEGNQKALASWGMRDFTGEIQLAGLHRTVRLDGNQFASLIQLSLEKMNAGTAYHEAWHSASNLLLSDQEIKIMEAAFPDADGIASTERAADAFADWVGKKKTATPGRIRLLFQKIKNFLEKIKNLLAGRGFTSVENLFGKAFSGELQKRGARTDGPNEAAFALPTRYKDKEAAKKATEEKRNLKIKLKAAEKASKEGYRAGVSEERAKANEKIVEMKRDRTGIVNQLKNRFAEQLEEIARAEELKDLKSDILTRNVEGIKKEIAEYAKKHLPQESQGALLLAVAKAKTHADLARAFTRIDRIAKRVERKTLIADFKDVLRGISESNTIAVSYRERIRDLLSNLEFSEGRYKRAKALMMDGGMDPVTEEMMAAMSTLARKPLSDLSTDEIRVMMDRVVMLAEIGKQAEITRKELWEARKEEIKERLVAGTVAIEKPEGKFLAEAQRVDLAITPIDPAIDRLDGGKGTYDGVNHALIKKPIDTAWGNFLDSIDPIKKQAWEKAQRLKLSNENFERIGIYAADQQDGGREKLLNNGLTDAEIDAINLSPSEMEFYQWMRKELDALWPRIAKIMADVYGKPLGKVKNYFSFMTDWEKLTEMEVVSRLIEAPEYAPRTKHPEMSFTKSRVGAGTQKIKLNAMDIFLRHTENAEYLINMGPTVKMLYEVANSKEYGAAAGDRGQKMMVEWLDLIARKGGIQGDRQIAILDILRRNVGVATMAFKLSSALVQPSSIVTGASMIGRYAFTGSMDVVTSKQWREFLTENFPEIRDRQADDPAFMELSDRKWLARITQIGLTPLKKLDLYAAASITAGSYQKYLNEHGLALDFNAPNKDAIAYAELMLRRTQASMFFKDVPLAISRGALTGNRSLDKMLFQFHNFALNNWSLIRHDLWRAGIRERNIGKAARIFTWLTLATLAEVGLRDLAGLLIGQDDDDPLEKEMAIEMMNKVPFLSHLVSAIVYQDVPIPVISTLMRIPKGIQRILFGKKPETKARGLVTTMEGAGRIAGVPGSAQAGQLAREALSTK